MHVELTEDLAAAIIHMDDFAFEWDDVLMDGNQKASWDVLRMAAETIVGCDRK